MSFVEIFLIAVGLSMDAFAVSICKGLGMARLNMRQALLIAVLFGGFQALMPAIGWLLGAQFAQYVTAFANWIAFVLLVLIGGKMLIDAIRGSGDNEDSSFDLKELFMLAIATSIDAFAVGVSFAFLEVDLLPSVSLIGITTFVLSLIGVAVGHQFGSRWERPSSIVGGIVLIAIGIKILLEGFGINLF